MWSGSTVILYVFLLQYAIISSIEVGPSILFVHHHITNSWPSFWHRPSVFVE